MNTPRNSPAQRGFTLMELMVAMAITTIIVTVLVSITSIAMDTWNRSRSELRAARQAKAMVDSMARDFESLVTRRGNTNEWLSAMSSKTLPGIKLKSTNAAELIFFSASTDRYDGEIGINNKKDKGGDVSCIAYRLEYKDPIDQNGNLFTTFVLNRLLVNPDNTFKDLLGKPDLTAAFAPYTTQLDDGGELRLRERLPVHRHLPCGRDQDGQRVERGHPRQSARHHRSNQFGAGDRIAQNQGYRHRGPNHGQQRDAPTN